MGLFKWLTGSGTSKASPHDPLLMVVTGKIYSWDGRRVELRGGSGVVNCLAQWRGAVYGGELGTISNYASGLDLNHPVPVAERGSVRALCLHDETLYDGSTVDKRFEIRKALVGDLVSERPGPISSLASHASTLFDGGEYGVYETLTSRQISDAPCDGLCSLDGRLYMASGRSIREADSGQVVGRGSGRLTALCSYSGRLVHSDFGGGIYDTLGGHLIVSYDAIDKVRGRQSKTQAASCLFQAHGLV